MPNFTNNYYRGECLITKSVLYMKPLMNTTTRYSCFEMCVIIICGMNETDFARVYGLLLGQTPTKLQGDYPA